MVIFLIADDIVSTIIIDVDQSIWQYKCLKLHGSRMERLYYEME